MSRELPGLDRARRQGPDALYALAMEGLRTARERLDGVAACKVLAEAADAGQAAAAVRLGICLQLGFPVHRDPAGARALYAQAADSGLPAGHYRMGEAWAIGLGAPPDLAAARAAFSRAAEGGHDLAMCQLAFMLEHGLGGERDPAGALAWIHRAALTGQARGAFELAVRYHEGIGVAQDPALAAAWLAPAAAAGHLGARMLAESLDAGGSAPATGERPEPELVDDARPRAPRVEPLCESPRIYRVRDLLDRRVCAHLMQTAAPNLRRSKVVRVDGKHEEDQARRSEDMAFNPGLRDLLVCWYLERIARLTYIPTSHQEPLVVLRYRPGGDEYRPHHDFFDPGRGHAAALEDGGQRVASLLTYLNPVRAGGETEFPQIGLKVPPRPGEGLLFFNVRPDGQLDHQTKHAGLKVVEGEKWLATCWMRERPRQPV